MYTSTQGRDPPVVFVSFNKRQFITATTARFARILYRVTGNLRINIYVRVKQLTVTHTHGVIIIIIIKRPPRLHIRYRRDDTLRFWTNDNGAITTTRKRRCSLQTSFLPFSGGGPRSPHLITAPSSCPASSRRCIRLRGPIYNNIIIIMYRCRCYYRMQRCVPNGIDHRHDIPRPPCPATPVPVWRENGRDGKTYTFFF